MLCPTCGADYVEGVAVCSDCGVELVHELPRLDDADPADDPLRLVRVAGPTEAPMIEELLKNNDIDSVIQGEASANTLPATGDLTEVRIWVRQSDQQRANELIEAFFDRSEEGDRPENEAG